MIYYQRRIDARRVRFSCETDDWDTAAALRDEYERRKGIGASTFLPTPEAPRLADFAKRYLAEDTAHLAATTRRGRDTYLRKEGPLLASFGDRRLDEITPAMLREWWGAEITAKGRTVRTGRAYLDVLASLLGYAKDLGLVDASPVPSFREQLRRKSRTKQGRAESEAGREVRPIEHPAELGRLVAAAAVEAERDFAQTFEVQRGEPTRRVRPLAERSGGLRALVAILAMLDAGLRMGEVAGLSWGQVRWGEGDEDPARELVIDRARSLAGIEEKPKSGRTRVVALSRRLRRVLLQLYRVQLEPGPAALVLPGFDPQNFRHRVWRRILSRARIGDRAPKDLRDTFASQLLSAGIPLPYVSRQLGHADIATTSEHYAKWCGGDEYREPVRLRAGELPCDLLERLAEVQRPQSDPTWASSRMHGARSEPTRVRAVVGKAKAPQHLPPRRPTGGLERETGFEPATLSLGS